MEAVVFLGLITTSVTVVKAKRQLYHFAETGGRQSHVWEHIIDSHLCLELGIVWEIIISSATDARQQVHYKVLNVR